MEVVRSQISIIIPCYNEEGFIKKCLESIAENDYVKDKMEILVVDGRSSDRTKEVVKEFIDKYPFIRLLDNPQRIVPIALNIGIKQSKGEVIIIMGTHTTYPKDYLSKLVYWLEKSDADSIGGICVTKPGADTFMAKAIALILASPFGVGNARFRTTKRNGKPKYVDTVPFGAYKREVIERIGLFDERLERNQDIEFNKRLTNVGGKILLVPEIVSYYYARPNMRSLWQNNFANGVWGIYTACLTKDLKSMSFRHFIPLLFVSGLFGSMGISPLVYFGKIIFIAILGSYFLLSLFFSSKIAHNNGVKVFFIMPAFFFTLHFSYGLGSLWGIIKVLSKKCTKYFLQTGSMIETGKEGGNL